MKRKVPEPNKVSKDAKEAVQECASEFIHFIVGEALDRCLVCTFALLLFLQNMHFISQVEKRKTIGGEDILLAMHALGFDSYNEPLRKYLTRFVIKILFPTLL
jgi:nuclear transcription Y subunit beta